MGLQGIDIFIMAIYTALVTDLISEGAADTIKVSQLLFNTCALPLFAYLYFPPFGLLFPLKECPVTHLPCLGLWQLPKVHLPLLDQGKRPDQEAKLCF